jgi:hypothetical protein
VSDYAAWRDDHQQPEYACFFLPNPLHQTTG